MKSNRLIQASRQIYARLLYLYPSAHRTEYGDAMLQLFHDQCRASYTDHGLFGMLTLWLRTFFDLGISAISEHLSAPGAKWGLLEATPNKPVPWKGVALVMIPGLIFFVSHIGTLSGEMWLYWALKWGPYVLMLPVFLTWLLTRKYPVWGLIPLGLFCSSLVEAAANQMTGLMSTYALDDPAQGSLLFAIKAAYYQIVYGNGVLWLATGFLILLALFLWVQQRRQQLSRAVWVWLGIYFLLSAAQAGLNPQNLLGLGSSLIAPPFINPGEMIF